MNVPLADLRLQYSNLKPEIDSAIQHVIENSQFILGKAVQSFEESFATAHHVKHCIAVGSGTDALHVALWALGIREGDLVATVPFSFIATLEAISLLGAKPVLVDIDTKTFTLDPQKLEDVLKSHKGKVKAIIPVHLYGQPGAMDQIENLAMKHGAAIVEDACQAHLAQWNGKFVGGFGSAAAFSFYPGKNLGAFGEAGAVTTNDDALATSIRQLRDHGQVEKYKHRVWGHNYRMDGIQGAVLGVKMKYLAAWTERRRQIARRYSAELAGVGDLVLPFEAKGACHVYHVYVLRSKQRARFQQFLSEHGVASALHYPIPLHLQEAYRSLGYKQGDFPASEQAAEEVISLPLYPELTEAQIEYVIATVKQFFSR